MGKTVPGSIRTIWWLEITKVGVVWIWFPGITLLWFLGSASSRRSVPGWRYGTPVILGLAGLFLGGTFDYGCCIGWGQLGGLIGIGTGFILGRAMAGERGP